MSTHIHGFFFRNDGMQSITLYYSITLYIYIQIIAAYKGPSFTTLSPRLARSVYLVDQLIKRRYTVRFLTQQTLLYSHAPIWFPC